MERQLNAYERAMNLYIELIGQVLDIKREAWTGWHSSKTDSTWSNSSKSSTTNSNSTPEKMNAFYNWKVTQCEGETETKKP